MIYFAFQNLPKHAFHLLLTFLDNSKGYPLNLYVDGGNYSTDPDPMCREALVQHFPQCRQLSVTGETYAELLDVNPIPAVAFPNLTSFQSDTGDEEINSDNWFWKAIGSRAPRLLEVTIPFVFPSKSIPYRRLTDLTIDWLLSDHFTDFLGILQLLGQLRSLRICGIVHDYKLRTTALIPKAIEMPLLATLILDDFRSNIEVPLEVNDSLLGCLFASLMMSTIPTFMLGCTDTEDTTDSARPVNWPSSLLAMLSRSSSLRQMTLWVQAFQGLLEQPISTLLRCTPHLTSFDLRLGGEKSSIVRPTYRHAQWTKYLPAFLSDLTSLHDPVVPNLTNLSIHISDMPTHDVVKNFAKLANSRSPTAVAAALGTNDGSGPVVSPLTTLQLKQYRSFLWGVSPPPQLVDTSELEEVIETARRCGVNIVMENVARRLAEIDSDVENGGVI
ncbi:hypothetical protein PM082_007844 [Marasmius tenuissimus]|nr:hypothetical protein PM082_007844 [Marasmius tenuissimus]